MKNREVLSEEALNRKGGNHCAEQKSTWLQGSCLDGSLRLKMFKMHSSILWAH